jgi:hypothetical protein
LEIIDDAMIDLAEQRLVARAEAVRAVKLGRTVETAFSLKDIQQGATNDGISLLLSDDKWPFPKTQPALYVIRAADEETAARLMKEFPVGKLRDFAGPRVNEDSDGSATLYVGSSESVQKRLTEHLWQAHIRTYAMHLGRWCKVTDGSVIVSVQAILNSTDRAVRQDLEDTVWRRLKPRLGKSGGR